MASSDPTRAPLPAADAAPAAWLAVEAGPHHCLLALGDTGEIFPWTVPQPVPHTLAWFLGVANLRGGLYGVARLDAFTPHLLLVDYRLRDHRSGIEAVSLIRQQLGPELPAFLVTGDTGPQRLREAHASGLVLLHKPVPAERLHAALLTADHLGSTRRSSSARSITSSTVFS